MRLCSPDGWDTIIHHKESIIIHTPAPVSSNSGSLYPVYKSLSNAANVLQLMDLS